MTDLFSLVKDTGAYKIVKGDSESGRLSHAYLLLTSDGDNLSGYLKVFAKLIACENGGCCGVCRACKLIDSERYADVVNYPSNGKDIVLVEDVSALIESSYIKPLESDKKIFLINHAETMNGAAQNKLLKTLEEPPKNVHIFLGATAEFTLLATLKSRVKKLEIPPFGKEKLYDALKKDYPDTDKLLNAIACSDGTVGKTVALYGDENLSEVLELIADMIVNMQSSADVLKYSVKISGLKSDFDGFLSALELTFRDMIVGLSDENLVNNKEIYSRVKSAKGYNNGALLYALDKINEASRRKKLNANALMLTEWLLFQILEGKYKWRKF